MWAFLELILEPAFLWCCCFLVYLLVTKAQILFELGHKLDDFGKLIPVCLRCLAQLSKLCGLTSPHSEECGRQTFIQGRTIYFFKTEYYLEGGVVLRRNILFENHVLLHDKVEKQIPTRQNHGIVLES